MKHSMKRWILGMAAGVALLGGGIVHAGAPGGDNQYFDWHDNTNQVPVAPGGAGSNLPSDYTGAPFLNDGDIAQVQAYLNAAKAAGVPLAVKIQGPILTATANAIFNNYNIEYVFADLEGASAVSQTATLVGQVHNSTMSSGASVGNYAFDTVSNDPSRSPTATTATDPLDTTYRTTGVNLNTEQLYPGQAEYRQGPVPQINGTTAAARDTAPDGSAIANLRTGLFMGTIMRLSAVTNDSAPGIKHIPYVSRFENFNNPSLDSDGNPANGYVFTNPTGDQMLSRQDFEAQMLHYRFRGATGYTLHEPGVVGYTQAQFQADARKGFEAANNQYGFGVPTGSGATYNNNPLNATPITTGDLEVQDALDGNFHSVDNEGVIFSGVSNTTGGQGFGGMTILVSNLSAVNRYIVLPSRIAGGAINGVIPNANSTTPTNPNNGNALPSGTVLIPAGSHRVLLFAKDANFNWNYAGDNTSAFDGDATALDRSGTGIPEPAAVSLLAFAGMGVLIRRPRRQLV